MLHFMLLAALATQCAAFAPSASAGNFRAVSAIASKARAKPALLGLRAAGKDEADGLGIVQQISLVSQVGPFAKFKLWIARSVAGNYDTDKINTRIDSVIASAPVAIFSFTTCPFCLKAKTLLAEELGVPASSITVVECDEDADGNTIRAELGARTGRTSMPSIWIRGEGYIGGCNDGPGLFPLFKDGKITPMLQASGAI